MRVSVVPVTPRAASSNIESLRVLATFLLVSYHVIGLGGASGLGIDYPHPLRFFADFLIDLRMPLFAFIAGWVYALRPVGWDTVRGFVTGKIRRLLVPGICAATLFWLVANALGPGAVGYGEPLLRALMLSYVHYWFLQAIFLLLISYALCELFLKDLALPVFFVATGLLFLLRPVSPSPYLMLASAAYLAPFFCLGIACCRYAHRLRPVRGAVIAACVVAVAIGVWLNLQHLAQQGVLSSNRFDLQSFLFSTGGCVLLWLTLPAVPALGRFGEASFTIYLYHVYGTSGARRLLGAVGVDNEWVIFVIAVMAGLAFPILLHQLLKRNRVSSALLLGLRARSSGTPRVMGGGKVVDAPSGRSP